MKMRYLLLMVVWLVRAECMERTVSVEDFSQALFDDKKEIVQSWIAMAKSGKIDVNAKDKQSRTGLICAADFGNVEVVRELSNVPGIKVNTRDKDNWTALMWAAYNGNVEIVRELLKMPGIDVNAKDEEGMTALMIAANKGNVEVVKDLLKVPGIDVNVQDRKGRTVLIWAAIRAHIDILRELLKVRKIDVNAKDFFGHTALVFGASYGNIEVVRELLKVPGIDVNAKDQGSGWTALMIAANKENVEVVRDLLKVPGIDANAQDKKGTTVLMIAANKGNVEVVRELLIVSGIDVKAQDHHGRTALIWAINKGNVEVVRELLRFPGIDVNAKNNDGYSALYLAIEKSQDQSALLLWAVGAQEEGLPALSALIQKVQEEGKAIFNGILNALNSGNLEEVKGYADRGFSLMIKNLSGNNPLHIAVNRNHPSHAKYLIAYNKQWLREKNKDGLNPLDLIYGHWGEENEQWNALIAGLPGEFTSDVEKAKKDWLVFKEKAFREGYEGMPDFSSEGVKGEKKS